MRIIVCVKQIFDLDQVRMNRETREPVLQNLPMVIGQIEKNALEEAVKIKETGQTTEIVVLSAGWPIVDDVVLECLARGGDKAIYVADPGLERVDAQTVAMLLAKAIRKIGSYDLILLGEGSTDDNSGQVGPALAEILGLPLAAYARQVQINGNRARVTESLEGSYETVEAALPLVITVTAEINEPRIPSIIEVMDASSKPQEKWSLADIGLSANDINNRTSLKILANRYPEQTRKGIMLRGDSLEKTAELLIQNLKKEGVLES